MTRTPPHETTIVQDQPYMEVFTEIGTIEHFLRLSVSQHLLPGMTYTQFELLRFFSRYGDGQTPAELAAILMMTKGAVTNVLQKLEAMGLVAVFADVADGRKKRVRITRKGIEACATISRALKTKTEALRSGFTDAEFRDALPFLRALRVFLAEVSEPDARAVASRSDR